MRENIFYGTIIFMALFLLPLFYLKLLQWGFTGDITLIAEAISFSGAILGGVISGSLTLVGVVLTLRKQKKAEMDRYLPKLLNTILKLRSNLSAIKEQIKKQTKVYGPNPTEAQVEPIIDFVRDAILNTNNYDAMIKQACEIDYTSLAIVRKMYIDFQRLDKKYTDLVKEDFENISKKELLDQYEENLINIINDATKEISIKHKKYIKEFESL